jgi:hypothetical protein
MLEVLRIIDECVSDCWGDVWTHYTIRNGDEPADERVRALQFRNFDRVADALVRRGLVTYDVRLELTGAGRAARGDRSRAGTVVIVCSHPECARPATRAVCFVLADIRGAKMTGRCSFHATIAGVASQVEREIVQTIGYTCPICEEPVIGDECPHCDFPGDAK